MTKNPPFITGENGNPVGLYQTEFNIDTIEDKETYLRFESVSAAFYLWINDQKVGYSQDSWSPAEFNISKYLKKGKNTLRMQVFRWCDGSYLEDQDGWRMSGIFRDVFLVEKPKVHLRDYFVTTTLTKNGAQFNILIELSNQHKQKLKGYKISVALFDNKGSKIIEYKEKASAALVLNEHIENAKLWSNEFPNLYKLHINLLKGNQVIDKIETHPGLNLAST